jgi:hypothetical protein
MSTYIEKWSLEPKYNVPIGFANPAVTGQVYHKDHKTHQKVEIPPRIHEPTDCIHPLNMKEIADYVIKVQVHDAPYLNSELIDSTIQAPESPLKFILRGYDDNNNEIYCKHLHNYITNDMVNGQNFVIFSLG